MKRFGFLILLLFIGYLTFSQEEASNWYFGENAGISFNDNGSVSVLNNGQLNTIEGCASISDNDGNLLLYTDGSIVYNRIHNIMQNGTGLLGDSSSTQSAIVVPKPDDSNIYYIFTVGSNQTLTGLKYSVVDMSLDNGLGGITQKNISLLNQCSEKVSAVLKDCQSGHIWVMTLSNSLGNLAANMNTFHAFEVTENGVNSTAVTSLIPGILINDLRGYLKFSPDGTKMVCANGQDGLHLYDFDSQTGIVSNRNTLNISAPNNTAYGLEFSPDSQLLYVTSSNDLFGQGDDIPANHQSKLVQFDLNATNIQSSQILLDSRTLYRSALQLGPDQKIYRTMSSTYEIGLPYLSVINNPNELGVASDYQNNAINLGLNNATQGLPPFITSFFTEKIDIIGVENISSTYLPLCNGTSFTLTAEEIQGATYTWSYNNTIVPETGHDLEVSVGGNYEVLIELNDSDCDVLEGEALVEYFPNPIANTTSDFKLCDVNNDGTELFDLSTKNEDILGTQDPSIYSIHYFESFIDANQNTNEISLFNNTSNPQEIFARVNLDGSPNCYDLTSFFIQVSNTPVISNLTNFISCDDGQDDGDQLNGQTNISLRDFDSDILGEQNNSMFDISYYSSLVNAENKTDPLPDEYYNSTPFAETIFVRIENNLNNDCYDIDSFEIRINPIPESFDTTLFQCEEDSVNNGITSFNLNEANQQVSSDPEVYDIHYYLSFQDAEDDVQPLNASSYQNTSNPQVIYAKVLDIDTGCYSISEVTLEVSGTQILDYQVPEVCDELDSEDGFNTFDLTEITQNIQSANNINHPITYYSSYDDALLEINELTSPYSNTVPYNQTIYARAENNNACYGIAEVTIRIRRLPQLLDDEEMIYCLNFYPETINLETGVIDGGTSYSYEWSTGETTYSIEVNEPGTYTVTATSLFGCTKSRTISVEPSNIATIETIDVTDASENNIISIIVSGEGQYEYALYNSNGVFAGYQDAPVFNNVPPGIYTVMVRDVKNDCGTVQQDISVIGFPKFFTPNNDGQNDTWNVYGVSEIFQPDTEILIFDKYGKLIKQIDPLGDGWNGTFNNEPLPSSDYWFSVDLQDGRNFKGHFTLKR